MHLASFIKMAPASPSANRVTCPNVAKGEAFTLGPARPSAERAHGTGRRARASAFSDPANRQDQPAVRRIRVGSRSRPGLTLRRPATPGDGFQGSANAARTSQMSDVTYYVALRSFSPTTAWPPGRQRSASAPTPPSCGPRRCPARPGTPAQSFRGSGGDLLALEGQADPGDDVVPGVLFFGGIVDQHAMD